MRHCELWLKSYRAHAWLGACLGSWHGEPARLVPIIGLSPDRGRAYLSAGGPPSMEPRSYGASRVPYGQKGGTRLCSVGIIRLRVPSGVPAREG